MIAAIDLPHANRIKYGIHKKLSVTPGIPVSPVIIVSGVLRAPADTLKPDNHLHMTPPFTMILTE